MIPNPGKALGDIAGRIGAAIAPQIENPYGATDAGLISLLLTMLAGEAESGVHRRLQDAAELKALFATATEAPNAEARTAFAASEPPSFEHGPVSAWLDEGLTLLIELHAWAEVEDPGLDQQIWSFLYRHIERYKFDF